MDHQQRALFYDNYRAALRHDCKAIADESPAWAKTVGKMLWPGKDAIEAGRTLNDKTNENRADRLSDEEERLIMRLAIEKRGFSAAYDFLADEIGMERAKARDRKDEMVELQSRIERSTAELRELIARQERLVRAPIAAVEIKKTA